MLKQLRIQLTIICVLTTGILLISMTAGLLYISEQKMNVQRSEAFQSNVNAIIYKLQSNRIIDTTWIAQLESGNGLIVDIEDNGNPLLFSGSWQTATDRGELIRMAKEKALSSYDFNLEEKPFSVLEVVSTTFDLKGTHQDQYQVMLAKIPSNYGWLNLTVLRDISQEQHEKFIMGLTYFLIILASLVFLFAFSWWFSGKSIRPIEKNRKEQTQFVAAASHELKSPLAVIRASLSAISTLNLDTDMSERHRFVQTADRECIRMSKVIEDLLFLASSDAKNRTISREQIEIDTLLTELYDSFVAVADSKDQKLVLNLPEYALPHIQGDKLRLEQALSILLDNACSYTGAGGTIRIVASLQKRWLSLSVADNGPGISDENKEEIFRRFFRVDHSRSQKNHYGLGLSIAKEIAELHGGQLTLSDTPGGGCTFTLRLLADTTQL